MSETKLLNCPFCGGEAKTSFVFGRAGIVCTNCDANIRMYLDASTEDAIKAWNTRKPVEDVLERLEKKIQQLHNVNWNAAMEKAIEIIKEGLNC